MRIAVIGTGYVGLVSGTCFAEIGHDVICVDVHPEKIENLKKGIMPIHEDGLEDMVKRHHSHGSLRFTTDYADAIPGAEVVLIAVGTPSSADGAADLRFVFQAAEEIGKHLTDYTVIVNKSTVPIGTADQVTNFVSKHANHAFDVVSNPEILREGIAVNDFMNPSRIIIGSASSKATERMLELYAPLACQKLIMSTRSAELTKYAANSFIATKISYINELARFAEKIGASIEDVALGIGTDPRIGMGSLRPGPGWGGSCFPKDVKAMMHMAHEQDMDMSIIEAAHHSNIAMREHVVKRLENALGDLSGKTIGVLGIAFKNNTDDIRESPAIDIMKHLAFRGASIKAYDPLAARGEDEHIGTFKRVTSSLEAAKDADALLIATEWEEFKHIDLASISTNMRGNILFDARNMLQASDKRLGAFTYLRIGN